MPKNPNTPKRPSSERTSAGVAHVAGQLLNGTRTDDVVIWLQRIADSEKTLPEDRDRAVHCLGLIDSMKRVAASALTQR